MAFPDDEIELYGYGHRTPLVPLEAFHAQAVHGSCIRPSRHASGMRRIRLSPCLAQRVCASESTETSAWGVSEGHRSWSPAAGSGGWRWATAEAIACRRGEWECGSPCRGGRSSEKIVGAESSLLLHRDLNRHQPVEACSHRSSPNDRRCCFALAQGLCPLFCGLSLSHSNPVPRRRGLQVLLAPTSRFGAVQELRHTPWPILLHEGALRSAKKHQVPWILPTFRLVVVGVGIELLGLRPREPEE
mmetsp:Transcript_130757/g.310159  ORF Transcript_130757/g.310159 Transcript_130757/m.310159 type:complete len:245 (-) Transcript_130757:487-1221(-)